MFQASRSVIRKLRVKIFEVVTHKKYAEDCLQSQSAKSLAQRTHIAPVELFSTGKASVTFAALLPSVAERLVGGFAGEKRFRLWPQFEHSTSPVARCRSVACTLKCIALHFGQRSWLIFSPAFLAARLTPAMPLELSSRRTRDGKRLGALRPTGLQLRFECRAIRAAFCKGQRSCLHLIASISKIRARRCLVNHCCIIGVAVFVRLYNRLTIPANVLGRYDLSVKTANYGVLTSFADGILRAFVNNSAYFIHNFSFVFVTVVVSWFYSHCLDILCNLKLQQSTIISNYFYAAKP